MASTKKGVDDLEGDAATHKDAPVNIEADTTVGANAGEDGKIHDSKDRQLILSSDDKGLALKGVSSDAQNITPSGIPGITENVANVEHVYNSPLKAYVSKNNMLEKYEKELLNLRKQNTELEVANAKNQVFLDNAKDLYSSTKQDLDKTVEELEAKKAHITKIESSLAQLRIENDRLFGQIQQKDSALNDMRQVQSAQMEHMSSLKSNHEVEMTKRMAHNTNLQNKIEDMSKEHANNSAKYDNQFRALNDKCKKEILDLNTIKNDHAIQLKSLTDIFQGLKSEVKIWKNQFETLEGAKKSLQDTTAKLKVQNVSDKATIDNLNREVIAAENSKAISNTQMANLHKQCNELQKSNADLESEVKSLKEEIIEKKGLISRLKSEMLDFKRNHLFLRQKAQVFQQKVNDDSKKSRIEIVRAQNENQQLLKKLKGLSEDKVNGDREISALKLEIETLQSKINEMENNHEFHRQETSSKLVEHVKEIDFHKENNEKLMSQSKNLETTIDKHAKHLQRKEESLEKLKSENEGFRAKISSLEEARANDFEKIDDLLANNLAYGQLNEQAKFQISNMTREIERQQGIIDEYSKSIVVLKEKNEEVADKMEEKDNQFRKMEEAKSIALKSAQTECEELLDMLRKTESEKEEIKNAHDQNIKQFEEIEQELGKARKSNEDYRITINELHETLRLFHHAHSLNRMALDSHNQLHKEVHGDEST